MLRANYIGVLILCVALVASCSNNQKKNQGKLNERPSENAVVSTPVPVNEQHILFFGTSLTAGYGLDQNEAYPALIQKKIDSLDLPYKVVNAGLSGETSAAGKSRIDWLLKQPVAVFVLELGANDGLRGIPVAATTANLQAIIDKVKEKYPQVRLVLTGMEVPPNMGDKYAADFRAMFKKLAEKNKMAFVPFLLKGVGGVPKLNQEDGIHPTAEGQKILAENVWAELKKVL